MAQKTAKQDYSLKVGKITLALTNQEKIYWPVEGITKGEMVGWPANKRPAKMALPTVAAAPQHKVAPATRK